MKPYTVLLAYPEYLCDGRLDTYMTAVRAATVKEAQLLAQSEASMAQFESAEDEYDAQACPQPDEFAVLAVIEGDHMDVKED